jgi:hypothetical protein
MPFTKGDPNINREGRPVGTTKPRWNNVQDLFNLTIEEWDALSPVVKVSKGIELMTLILSKVPSIHLTAEESVINVVGLEIQKAKDAVSSSLTGS